jgi:uncharacterized membrane protein YkgB
MKLFFERAMHNMSVELRKWLYRVMPWLAGILLTGLVGGTVLVTDGSMPSDLQGEQWMWLSAVMTVVLPLWLAGYIVNPQRTVRIVSETMQWVLMGFGAVEALHGLGQIAGIYPSNHSLFVLTGTFYNPGPYSGYLAAVLPIALYRMLVLKGKKDRLSVVQYYLSMCVLLLICCVLPAGMSRAAWFASLLSCGYVVLRVYHVKVKSFVSEHRYAVLGVLILGLLFVSGAYFMKRDSADGRLLIWKIISRAIACNPWGEENGRTFSAIYGDTQERYFTDCEYSESEAWVAGTPDFAFNEYMQIAVEYGVWVSVLLVTVLLMLLKIAGSRKHLAGMGGCLVSLMIFACFSYPLHIPAIVSVWLLAVIVLSGEGLVIIKRKRYAVAVLLPVVVAGLTASVNMYGMYSARTRAVREWMPVRILYHSGAFKAAVDEYEKFYDKMSWDKDFCFEYGRALYKAGSYGKAEEVLLKAMTVSGDPMILNILGRNAHESGEYGKAEKFLLRSTRRLPERVYSHYLLVKLYAEPEYFDRVKLVREAEYVLNTEPKVNSTAIREMRHEVKKILEDKMCL